jgi:predicted TIM-barrel fold metal-dependent hydrolase
MRGEVSVHGVRKVGQPAFIIGIFLTHMSICMKLSLEAGLESKLRVFDCHSHWGTRRGYIFRTEAELARQESVFKTKPVYMTEEEQAAYLRANGVRAILDLSFTKSLPVEEVRALHDYAFDVQARYADVIVGQWLQFDPRRQPDPLREFERCLAKGAGFAALCINGQSTGLPASDPIWDPFYEYSIDAGLPVMILTGLTGIGQGAPGGAGIVLDGGHPRHIDRVAARFPELRVLAARPAYPWQDEMIAVLIHKANVSYELHGWSPRRLSPALKAEIAGRLQDRVMIGCDFPMLRYEKIVREWQEQDYPSEILEKILCRNAERYFGLSHSKRER